MEPRFYLTDEVAELLRTPAATLRYWRHIGEGPESMRVGRRVLYPAPALEAWLCSLADERRSGRSRMEQHL